MRKLLAIVWVSLLATASAADSPALDRLDAKNIPAAQRFEGQPAELVGIVGEALPYTGDGLHQINHVGFSPDGRFLVIASGASVKLWDLKGESAKKFAELEARVGRGWCFGFLPGGERLVVLARRGLVLYDLTREPPAKLGDSGPIGGKGVTASTIGVSEDGKRIALGMGNGGVQVWELADNEFKMLNEIAAGHKGATDRVLFSPDGQLLVSGGFEGGLRVGDAAGKVVHPLKQHQGHTWTMLFSPDGKLLVSNSNSKGGFPRIWDISAGAKVRSELKGHSARVRGAVFANEGKQLVTLGSDGQLVRWNVANGERVGEWKLPARAELDWHNVAVTADGRYLAAVDVNSQVAIFRLK
ncbi:MAG: WD40 repeat domain-containing protein [Gemmataceae bacterium]